MTLLLRKYASKIHFMDFDDSMQELFLTLIECVEYLDPAKRQKPRCKQRGIKFVTLQSSGVFDPRSSRQMDMQAYPHGSLPTGINPPNPTETASIIDVLPFPFSFNQVKSRFKFYRC